MSISPEAPQNSPLPACKAPAPECAGAGERFPSPDVLKWSVRLLAAYFAFRLVFFACAVSPAVPPDEVTHAGLCRTFASAILFPRNSLQTYEYGLVTNIPWLYYWILGKLLHLNVFGLPDLVFLRLLNIPMAFGTVIFARRLLFLLTGDRLAQLLLVIVMTNIAMFSLLSASVSPDNLTILLATMGTYYLFAFFRERSPELLAASLLSQLAGCLTKVTILPLVLILGVLLIVHERRHLWELIRTCLLQADRRHRFILAGLVIALLLNLQLYGGNLLAYGTPVPEMAQVVSPEHAREYRIAARETIFRLYSEEKISYMDALVMAGDIRHPGDKADTFFLLMNYEKLKRNPGLWLSPLQYAGIWISNIAGSIFGIKGHLQMYKSPRDLIPVYLVISLALCGFVVRWRPRQSGWLPLCLAATACFYTGYIFYKVNYGAYLHYGTPGVTLQGRYLFLVLAPFSVLLCHYLMHLFRAPALRLTLALATALLFIGYDFPWFLLHATPEWYQWMPR